VPRSFSIRQSTGLARNSHDELVYMCRDAGKSWKHYLKVPFELALYTLAWWYITGSEVPYTTVYNSELVVSNVGQPSPASMSPAVDRKATHGWGSSPSQRHYIGHEQALKILEAGVKRAKEIKYVASDDSLALSFPYLPPPSVVDWLPSR
jgi:hypothetical protein